MHRNPVPLRERAAVITGVSRRVGIGYVVARRRAALGASLYLHHYLPGASGQLFQAATAACGHLDILVCHHACSGGDGPLGTLDAAQLDAHWAVDTRSSILLARAFAAQHDGRAGGRVIFMTSGQDLGPMPGEVAYAASKGALASVTKTVADQLADRRVHRPPRRRVHPYRPQRDS